MLFILSKSLFHVLIHLFPFSPYFFFLSFSFYALSFTTLSLPYVLFSLCFTSLFPPPVSVISSSSLSYSFFHLGTVLLFPISFCSSLTFFYPFCHLAIITPPLLLLHTCTDSAPVLFDVTTTASISGSI